MHWKRPDIGVVDLWYFKLGILLAKKVLNIKFSTPAGCIDIEKRTVEFVA